MDSKETKGLLTGVWEVTGHFRKESSEKQPVDLFKSGDYFLGFPSERIITERRGDSICTTICSFDEENNTLSIQPTDCNPASPISGREDPVYRVIRLDDKEMRLLRPHTVESEDTDSLFELFLLRRPK